MHISSILSTIASAGSWWSWSLKLVPDQGSWTEIKTGGCRARCAYLQVACNLECVSVQITTLVAQLWTGQLEVTDLQAWFSLCLQLGFNSSQLIKGACCFTSSVFEFHNCSDSQFEHWNIAHQAYISHVSGDRPRATDQQHHHPV